MSGTSGWDRLTGPILGSVLTVATVLYVGQIPYFLGVAIHAERLLALTLGISLALVFLRFAATGRLRSGALPWYDGALAALGLAAGLYLVVRYPDIASNSFARRSEAFAVGIVLLPLILEALRRSAGLGLTIIVSAFLLYGLFGHLVPGQLEGRSQPFVRLVAYLAIDPNALFGLPLRTVVIVVIAYIFLGQLLQHCGGGEWFNDLATALIGRTRGGAAKVTVVSSALFGMISGSAVANVVSSGVLTIPLMRRTGLPAANAAAFEAVSSTGGQITPPVMGAAAFLMAEFLQVPYAEVALAAAIPALLFYLAIYVQADAVAIRRNLTALPDDQIVPWTVPVLRGAHFFIPFVVLVVAMFNFNREAEEAALWAVVTLIVLASIFPYRGQRLNGEALIRSLSETGIAAIDIIVVGAMAGLIVGVIEVTGLGFGLTLALVELGQNNLGILLLLTAIVCLVLGMGMPTTAVYFLVATLAAAPLIKLGVPPLAAHMFVFYYGMLSMITPPVALAAYAAANLAAAPPNLVGWLSCLYGWPAFLLPFLFVLSPALLLQGPWLAVALAIGATALGVWSLSAAVAGVWRRPLARAPRLLLAIAGLALLLPANSFAAAPWINALGVALAAILAYREWRPLARP